MVYIMLADGFETIEALGPLDILRRGAVEVKTVGVTGLEVTSGQGVTVRADILPDEVGEFEMLVLPGGAGVETLKKDEGVVRLIRQAFEAEKLIGAICAAPTILSELGLLAGYRAVCFPAMTKELSDRGVKLQADEFVTHDRNIITANAAGSSIDFGLKLLAMLRGWEASEKVRRAIYYQPSTRALT